MIPWILIIVGGVSSVTGVLGLVSLFIYRPIKEKLEVEYDRDYDFIRARLDPSVQKYVRHNRRELINIFIVCLFMGVILFCSGIYLGYADKGEGFWFYKLVNPNTSATQEWDRLNDEGQFVSEDGQAYTYYVRVSGQEIFLREEPCTDVTDLKNKLSQMRRDNKVILFDDFAVSSTYHAVEAALNELGMEFEEER